MIKYELISPELIISPAAYRVYRASAFISTLLFVWLCVSLSQGGVPQVRGPLGPPLLFIPVLAAAANLVGMEIFLFRFDNSHALKQVFWFCVMLLPLLGAAGYCFFVYSRSDVFKARTEQAHSASA